MNVLNTLKNAAAAVAAGILPDPKKTAESEAPATPAPTPPKKPGPDPKATELLFAHRAPEKNTRLLVAYKPNTDPNNPNNLVSVNVRDNRRFLPGMRLHVRHVQGTIYDLVGPLPRWRGRY